MSRRLPRRVQRRSRAAIALGIRAQLLLVLTVFLAIPWLGYEYVRELERFLRDAQERTLAGTAQAVATALHDRPRLFEANPGAGRHAGDRAYGGDRRAADRCACRSRLRRTRGRTAVGGNRADHPGACRARPRASGWSIATSTCSPARAASRARAPPTPIPGRRDAVAVVAMAGSTASSLLCAGAERSRRRISTRSRAGEFSFPRAKSTARWRAYSPSTDG